ncbi:MAG: hypothetical protein QM757_09270 [Paludibaculum sp.]
MAKQILALGLELKPMKLEIDSSVPTGSGLSSSAALEVSSALALLGDNPISKLELAKLCQRAEREFVGMPCGIMDQYASVFGEAHKAIMLDCRSNTHKLAPIPDGAEIVVVNSMVKHELGSSAYRDRVAECHQALSHFPGKEALRTSPWVSSNEPRPKWKRSLWPARATSSWKTCGWRTSWRRRKVMICR